MMNNFFKEHTKDLVLGQFVYRLIKNDGSIVNNPEIEGLDVKFQGRLGGILEVHEGSVFENTKIILGGMSKVIIRKTHSKGIKNTKIETSCPCKNKLLYIDEQCSVESARFAMVNDSNLFIKIGKDCMLSSNIVFRSADGHTIFDKDTKQILNKSEPIILGNHVWVGSGVTFLKGAVIPNNTIVGTNSLISKKYETDYVAIAGTPGKIVKNNINWDRKRIDEFDKEN